MPDPNKHAALAANGFKLQPTCSTCVHWVPTNPPWGHCAAVRYSHEKHSARTNYAGTPDIGWCESYGQDLRSLSIAAGDDYAARYAPESSSPELDPDPTGPHADGDYSKPCGSSYCRCIS